MAISDNAWDVAVPADSEFIKNGPKMVRDAKNQLGYRTEQEHTAYSSSSPDYGGIHRQGTARVYADNTIAQLSDGTVKRPASPTDLTLAAAYDEGRLALPTDGNNGLYIYNGSDAWVSVGIAGMNVAVAEGTGSSKVGDQVAILPGRTGGQSLHGGTGSGDALNLGGSTHADEGPINIVAADTTIVNFNSVRATLMGVATTIGDAVGVGVAGGAVGMLSGADVQITEATNNSNVNPGIAIAVIGTGTPDGSNLVTADLGFVPDFILGWNDGSGAAFDPIIYHIDDDGATKRFDGTHDATPRMTVSGEKITFVDGGNSFVNNNAGGVSAMFYVALKFNHRRDAT